MAVTREAAERMLAHDLDAVLEHARHVFRHYGVSLPNVMLVARDPVHDNMIVVHGNDTVPEFAAQLAKSNARPPAHQGGAAAEGAP